MSFNLKTTIPYLAFAVLAFAYLMVTAQDLFFVVQSQDMFVYDWQYYKLLAETPGFAVAYIGSFLTQFAFYPWLGIALYVILLLLLSLVIKWAFRIPAHLASLTLLPSLLLMMFVMGWDYGVFASRHFGNIFSPVIGLILTAAIVGGFVRLKHKVLRYVCVVFSLVCLYPFIGFYALLSCGAILLTDWVVLRHRDWILSVLTIALMVFVPMIVSRWLFVTSNTEFAWLAGLPHLDFYRDITIWIPMIIALVIFVILPLSTASLNKQKERTGLILSSAIAVLAVIAVPVYSNKDSNFHTLLAVEHAYETGNDDRVLPLCAAQERPIRSLIVYRNVELYRRGELLDKMFQFTWDYDTIVSKNIHLNTVIAGPRIYQKFTLWNFSYRRAMEHFVKYNPSYVDTKLMATAILYNQEPELADKYLSLLENTLFYKDWASSQRRLLDEAVLKEDSLFRLHKQIIIVPKGALDNTEYCEYMLLKHFTNLYVNTETRAVLSLAAAMVTGNEDVFWQLCLAMYRAHSDQLLPRHVQEAALLFALKHQNQQLFEQIQLMVGRDGAVCQKFLRNQDLFVRLLSQPTQTDVNTLGTLYPGTYWYYYFINARQTLIYD